MKLSADLTSNKLIHAKGFLFLFLGLLSVGILLFESPHFRTVLLLGITIWSFCRFYYYLFYVLDRYLGREKRFAGVCDALGYLFRAKGDSK